MAALESILFWLTAFWSSPVIFLQILLLCPTQREEYVLFIALTVPGNMQSKSD